MVSNDYKDVYMTGGDVCDLCHVHPNTVHRWRKAGKLEGVKIGRGYLYKTADVMALVRGGVGAGEPLSIGSMSDNAE